jgi:cytochrome c-type biogenesis protein CcmH/NrfG
MRPDLSRYSLQSTDILSPWEVKDMRFNAPCATQVSLGIVALCLFLSLPETRAQDTASHHYEEALKAFESNDLEGAALQTREALNKDPAQLPSLVLLARIYLRINEPVAAEDTIKRARRLGADANITWPLRAKALLR